MSINKKRSLFGYRLIKDDDIEKITENVRRDYDIICAVKSLLWQIGSHGEKVPGTLRAVINLLYPDTDIEYRRNLVDKVDSGLMEHCRGVLNRSNRK